MSVYKEKQQKVILIVKNDIMHNYVMVMKVIRRFFQMCRKKRVLIANLLRSLFQDLFQRTVKQIVYMAF